MEVGPTLSSPFVVVGGGPAAAAATRVLASHGHDVLVLTAEDRPPYDRTHLSKQVLVEGTVPPALWSPEEHWRGSVEVRTLCNATAVDLADRRLQTGAGVVEYERLLLATGATPRRLALPGADGPGVHQLRDLADARRLADELVPGRRIAVVGGGLIGLEVAAAAVARGCVVEVLEAAPRVLTRGVPAPVAALVAERHARAGVQIRTEVLPVAVERGADGAVAGVRLADGTLVPADSVVVGVGVVPRDGLAAAAGLTVDDGIVVNGSGRTSDASVWAAGDAVRTSTGDGRGVRLESFTDAQRQGTAAAASMLGREPVARQAPYAWSDQYDLTVSSIGIMSSQDDLVTVAGLDAVAVLALGEPAGSVLRAACVAGPPAATGRLVATCRNLVERAVAVDVDELRAAPDIAALTKLLRAVLRTAWP